MSDWKGRHSDLPEKREAEDVESENPEPEEDLDLAGYDSDRHQCVETDPVEGVRTDDLSDSEQDEKADCSLWNSQESRGLNCNTLKENCGVWSDNQACTGVEVTASASKTFEEDTQTFCQDSVVACDNCREVESVPESDRGSATCDFSCVGADVTVELIFSAETSESSGKAASLATDSQPTKDKEIQPEDEMLEPGSWSQEDVRLQKHGAAGTCYLDREESPPEDELFLSESARTNCHRETDGGEQLWNIHNSTAAKGDIAKKMQLCEIKTTIPSAEAEVCLQTADSPALFAETPGKVAGSCTSADGESNEQGAEKEDDMIPECDRKQDISPSSTTCENRDLKDESCVDGVKYLRGKCSSNVCSGRQQSSTDEEDTLNNGGSEGCAESVGENSATSVEVLVPECDINPDIPILCAVLKSASTKEERCVASHVDLISESRFKEVRQEQQSDFEEKDAAQKDVDREWRGERVNESAVASEEMCPTVNTNIKCNHRLQEEEFHDINDDGFKPQACITDKSECKQLACAVDSETDSEEELMMELDAELKRSSPSHQRQPQQPFPLLLPQNGLKQFDTASSQLCEQFQAQLKHLQEQLSQKEQEIRRLQEEKSRQRQVAQEVLEERNKFRAELTALKDKNPDDLYLPQIKELEYTITQQQTEIRQLKEKLTSHDAAAKKAIATLQTEMKGRIEQITKLYEEATREKDSMVVRFAEAETKNMESKRAVDRQEARIRDLLKEKDLMNNKIKAALAEKQKAMAELETKVGERIALGREIEKMKEELSSADYRIKWFQNKLKAELDAHKETKTNLEKTATKLKEAKEETEQIRHDCQAIIKTYQESEEVRSNSLDKELKMKEMELMIQMKQKTDTEEIHQKTKRELEMVKQQYKCALGELKALKDKVQCLEEERLQVEQLQSKYQAIIQNQKGDNAEMQKKLAGVATLQEDFDRAQEMIRTLDHEIGELKISNRDLQKDMEGCQTRESKMLALQSELSRTNALLRSENTNFNNQIVTLSGEIQKMKMEIQDLETRCRDATENLEEEQKKRKEETASLAAQVAEKTRECEEYKQKWEDEIDSNKTLKRKHMNNIKDLTRQLHSARKRLDAYETGSGERDNSSMGSRTNSNGSLNSADNSQQNHHHAVLHNHLSGPVPSRASSQESEYPVVTEQVEVDKQLLIERIVRLQKSLARKNEKLEFLEEHIHQLVAEIKRKNKIIQGYVMREEAGTLASEDMDANKLAVRKEVQALLARKGGIMASVYSMHQQDGTMTLDLSLEINRKLQAVLEDTLLKNMTLKESLDTLGTEIARLSQENRRLQLHLQGLSDHG